MTDKTAAELVSDYARTMKALQHEEDKTSDYASNLVKTASDIKREMREWYDDKVDNEERWKK